MKRISNWTDQEDRLLLKLYNQVDCFQKWKFISENFKKNGFLKSQIQCRQRFVNKLNPELRQDKLSPQQLKLLFQYYDQYGPLWSVFQSLIPGRNQNLLKNKFYSTLRSLVRILIASSQRSCNKKNDISSTSLSSKLLVQIYEGKKGFRKYKGVFRSFLNQMNFQIDLEKVKQVNSQLAMEILERIKSDIQNSKKLMQKKKQKGCLGYGKKVKKQMSNQIQQNINSTLIVVTEQIKQKQVKSQNQQRQNQGAKNFQVPMLPCMSFYLPQMGPINYVLPFWGFGLYNQQNINQLSS